MVTFDIVFDRVIGHEGGYVDDPHDPGGETKWGISRRAYPSLDIKNLTRQQARAIYYADFWMKVQDIKYPSLMFQIFDAAFNHGFGNAVRILQRAIGVADDGVLGPISHKALEAMNEDDILFKFIAYRLKFFVKLQKFDRFGRGWSDRIANNLLYAAEDNG